VTNALLNVGNTVSFQVYPSVFLGTQFKDVVVQSIINAETARLLGFDFVSMHANVYPTLPAGQVPDNPTQYNYLLVKMPAGQMQIVGIPWIDESTITSRVSTSVYLEVPGAGTTNVQAIITALAANGFVTKNVRVDTPST